MRVLLIHWNWLTIQLKANTNYKIDDSFVFSDVTLIMISIFIIISFFQLLIVNEKTMPSWYTQAWVRILIYVFQTWVPTNTTS